MKIIEAIKTALADLYAGKDFVAVINALLTAIFSNVAENEDFVYPEA